MSSAGLAAALCLVVPGQEKDELRPVEEDA
jgi:hypothetical protein